MNNTIIAIATPPGQGGISVLRMSGENALAIADDVIKLKNQNKCIKDMPGYTAAYGHVMDKDEVIDDVVALVFRKPNSFTGEDTVEISCHGGDWISQKVLQVFLSYGANMAAAGEFTKRAFLNNKISLAQAEGVMELISANSMQQAICARSMLDGKTNKKVDEIKSKLMDQSIHLSAWMDYPEEEVEEVEEQKFTAEIHECRMKMDDILSEYDEINRMKNGLKIVIFGNPNVGKSTIFNVLLGKNRAITTPIAGTTRDILIDELNLQGYPIFLYDTAGIRDSIDPIEAEGIKRTTQELDKADMLLAVFDAGNTNDDKQNLYLDYADVPKIAIINKNDLSIDIPDSVDRDSFDDIVSISAKEKPEDAEILIKNSIIRTLELRNIDPNVYTLMSDRQVKELRNAQLELVLIEEEAKIGIIYDIAMERLRCALQSLSFLSGENPTDEMIDQIFERFCVGK